MLLPVLKKLLEIIVEVIIGKILEKPIQRLCDNLSQWLDHLTSRGMVYLLANVISLTILIANALLLSCAIIISLHTLGLL